MVLVRSCLDGLASPSVPNRKRALAYWLAAWVLLWPRSLCCARGSLVDHFSLLRHCSRLRKKAVGLCTSCPRHVATAPPQSVIKHQLPSDCNAIHVLEHDFET